ncbi:MAG: 3-keto-5-aminohexanoate cleavage protein [Pseudomonadota bacterium]
MLQACLNGARSPEEHAAVPRTPEAIARDFAACVAAGADEGHLHPYAGAGESLVPEVLADVVTACRHATDRPFGVSTHDQIPSQRGLVADISNWTATPDYASVNFYQADAPAIRRALESVGVGTEAGIWSVADVAKLGDGPPPYRILIEVLMDDPAEALAEADRILSALDKVDISTPRLLHGEGGSAWPLLRRAQALGLAARIGFEDVIADEEGRAVADNSALIAAACRQSVSTDDYAP